LYAAAKPKTVLQIGQRQEAFQKIETLRIIMGANYYFLIAADITGSVLIYLPI
jgi:hypothetical protein